LNKFPTSVAIWQRLINAGRETDFTTETAPSTRRR
jgi:hypothetical protein